jgi:DNA-binding GntR family transcriptional regulator
MALAAGPSPATTNGRGAMLLQRDTLHSGVSEALRDMITSGEMIPGSKINEGALCERFGISRTPLREALKALAVEGLIQLVPRHGARVAQITELEIDELFPIMAALESLAGKLACARMRSTDVAAFRHMHKELFAFYESGDEVRYLKLNRQIHRHLFTVAGNASLTAHYEQLLVRIHAVRFVARKTREQWHRAVEEHRGLLAAIEARDGEQLARLLDAHLTGTAANIARRTLPTLTAETAQA